MASDSRGPAEVILLVSLIAMLAARLGLVLGWLRRGTWLPALRGLWKQLISHIGPLHAPQDAVEQAVQEKLRQLQVLKFRRTLETLAVVSTLRQCLDVVALTMGSMVDGALSTAQCLSNVAFDFVVLLLQCYPGLIGHLTRRLAFAVMVLAFSAYIAPGFCAPNALFMSSGFAMAHVTLISVAMVDASAVAAGSAVFLTTGCSWMVVEQSAPVGFNAMVLFGALFLTGVWFMVAQNVALMEAQIRSEFEANELKTRVSANSALLRMFYDAVVEVDEEANILEPGDLAQFLQVQTAGPLRKVRLVEFLSDPQDSALLLQRLQEPLQDVGHLAGVMHVTMRRGACDTFGVELFSFRFEAIRGSLLHLIGLREFGSEPDAAPSSWPNSAPHVGPVGAQPVGDVPASSPSEDAATLSTLPPALREVTVMVKAEAELPIVACSEGFRQEIGEVQAGHSLMDVMDVNKDDFEAWIQRVINCCLNQVPVLPFRRVRLLRQNGLPLQLPATCEVVLKGASKLIARQNSVALTFHLELSRGRSRSSGRSSSRRSSSGSSNGTAGGGGSRVSCGSKRSRSVGRGTPSAVVFSHLRSELPSPCPLETRVEL